MEGMGIDWYARGRETERECVCDTHGLEQGFMYAINSDLGFLILPMVVETSLLELVDSRDGSTTCDVVFAYLTSIRCDAYVCVACWDE